MGDIEARFGERLRELRARKGLSQEQLAAAAKIARTFLGGVERGQRSPTLSSLSRLANALGVSLPELVDVDAKAPRTKTSSPAARFGDRFAALARGAADEDAAALAELLERLARLYFKSRASGARSPGGRRRAR